MFGLSDRTVKRMEDLYMDGLLKIEQIREDFIKCRKLLIAIGDETRQTIITVLMGNCFGMRVGEITKGTHLSRPAVSHHLRIMLDCGLVTLDKQGTKNFYSLNIGKDFQNLFALFDHLGQFKEAMDAGLLTGCE
jgi:ArsR family transcriptional regulator